MRFASLYAGPISARRPREPPSIASLKHRGWDHLRAEVQHHGVPQSEVHHLQTERQDAVQQHLFNAAMQLHPCEASLQQRRHEKEWSENVTVLAITGKLPRSLLPKVNAISASFHLASSFAITKKRAMPVPPLRTLLERRKSIDNEIIRHRTETKLIRVFKTYGENIRYGLNGKSAYMDALGLKRARIALSLEEFSMAELRQVDARSD